MQAKASKILRETSFFQKLQQDFFLKYIYPTAPNSSNSTCCTALQKFKIQLISCLIENCQGEGGNAESTSPLLS